MKNFLIICMFLHNPCTTNTFLITLIKITLIYYTFACKVCLLAWLLDCIFGEKISFAFLQHLIQPLRVRLELKIMHLHCSK